MGSAQSTNNWLEVLKNNEFQESAVDNNNQTVKLSPLLRALAFGHEETALALIDSGLGLNAKDAKGASALHYAINAPQILRELLETQNPNSVDSDGNSALILAAAAGNLASVELLIANDADVNLGNNDGETALHQAVEESHCKIVNFLLQHGAEPNTNGFQGSTPLHRAVFNGNLEIFSLLLKFGADLTEQDASGANIAHIAAAEGRSEILEFILSKDFPLTTQRKDGTTPLMLAILCGHYDLARILIENSEEEDVNIATKNGDTALHFAAAKGNQEITQQLLELNASTMDSINAQCFSPLTQAILAEHLNIVRLLLHFDADPNVGRNLEAAALKGNIQIAKLLLMNGALIEYEDEDKAYSALMNAVMAEQNEMVVFLVEQDADPNYLDSYSTPFHAAVSQANTFLVDFFARNGAKIDLLDHQKLTPLALAAYYGHGIIVEQLIRFGSSLDFMAENGDTPLNLAAQQGHLHVVKTLVGANADINKRGRNKATPLAKAAYDGYLEIAEFLVDNGAKIEHSGALNAAVQMGKLEMLEFLLDNGANIDESNGKTALEESVESGNFEIAKYLIGRGASLEGDLLFTNAFDAEICQLLLENGAKIGTNDFLYACRAGKTDIVRLFLAHGADPNAKEDVFTTKGPEMSRRLELLKMIVVSPEDEKDGEKSERDLGDSALHAAVQSKNLECVRLLLEAGADPNAQGRSSRTPIFYADSTRAKELIERGADLTVKDGNGDSILHFCSDIDTLALLLQNKVPVDGLSTAGYTALYQACAQGNVSKSRFLIEYKANPNFVFHGDPILYSAVSSHVDQELIRLLLNSGSEPNAPNSTGQTALMKAAIVDREDIAELLIEADAENASAALSLAAKYGNESLALFLLRKGANPNYVLHEAALNGLIELAEALVPCEDLNARGHLGRTPLINAAIKGHSEIITMLLEAGADINSQDDHGDSALDLAAQFGQTEAVKLLSSFLIEVTRFDE